MTAERFELDESGLSDLLTDMKPARRAAAEAIVTRAAGIAPRVSGDYAGSLSVIEDGETIAASSSDPFAHLVEYGSVNNPPYRPLSRAVEDLGMTFRDGP